MKKAYGRGGEKLAAAVQELVRMMLSVKWPLKDGLKEHHRGGVLTIRSRKTGKIRSIWIIGNPPADRLVKYAKFSKEKGLRLNWMLHKGTPGQQLHLSSWQSRNPDRNQWGGAILTKDDIVSFSGMPELTDEVLLLVACVALRAISTRRADRIALASSNDAYWDILRLILQK